MPAGQLAHLLLVVLTQELPNHLLRDIATNVLVVVALTTHLLLLDLLENIQPATSPRTCHEGFFPLGLWLLWTAEDDIGSEAEDGVPDERAIPIGDFIGVGEKLADE